MIKILAESFVAKGKNARGYEVGEVAVESARGVEKVVAYRPGADGNVYAVGFIGQYQSKSKLWRASVYWDAHNKRMAVWFGRDDRSGRFQKENGVSYAPEAYAALLDPDFLALV